MDGSAYILGDSNSTVVTDIEQSATLRCLAGGHPKPFVTWWRGDQILPFKNDRVEITRDYSLILTKVDIVDLGPYVCQAYNSIGRPVSIQVTLKTHGPVHARNEEERNYLQYVESEPFVPTSTYRPYQTAPQTRPTHPRTRPTPYYPPIRNVTVVRTHIGECLCLSLPALIKL